MDQRIYLQQTKRLVVKIGTSLLTQPGLGIDRRFITRLAKQIADLRGRGVQVIVVTSGAIGAAVAALGRKEKPRTIPDKQAMAAIGQPLLMQAYARAFDRLGLRTAQVLLTGEDIRNRHRYAHARNAMQVLLQEGVVPIINENDTVAVEEIKFGDNDTLSAHITNLSEADLLVILSDVAGLFTCHPGKHADAKLLSRVAKVDHRIEDMACGPGTALGTGGMATKLTAAKMVTGMGVGMVIADGHLPRVLIRLLAGDPLGTFFLPQADRLAGRKRWIGYALKRRGLLRLDAGAVEAVKLHGKSLLPSGIRSVEGRFAEGDCVGLADEAGQEFARGLVNYRSDEVTRLCGVKTRDIERVLGYRNTDEVIHRDDLVLLG